MNSDEPVVRVENLERRLDDLPILARYRVRRRLRRLQATVPARRPRWVA